MNSDIYAKLKEEFSWFTVSNLHSVTKEEFHDELSKRIEVVDARMEGYSAEELDRQRDLSIKFHWGHDHDFGSFSLKGRMGERHLQLMTNFITNNGVGIDHFQNKHVLDVGCWTGGTTLLLSRLGARVTAVEEVKKYAEMVNYLADCFDLSTQISVLNDSLFNMDDEKYYGMFDSVYFPGVVYHLSDPVLGLRILYNSTKIGGDIFVESAGINSEESICQFEGSRIYHADGSCKEELNRGGWNWFLPSPLALKRMMEEAGYDEVETFRNEEDGRVYGYGKKVRFEGICKAGFAKPDML
ncbi:class I SAM-dependent methyltransferase [uncultured Pseudodesulfovibrio sp.]|uniref:class I SAM-dependent methyltransferase n=1 Tax=uncultured Pseudodesulfovibrio sp. TaxID=2035858 RepID=UPI0029C63A54|nr:class I SAM-dependent methyltransferase [uncultured Pseudodesulfovibrio sp.]